MHCKEEKHVLKKELTLKILFLFFISQINFAQIPINGFCKLTELKVKPNYTNVYAVDFNTDGYRDLVFYSEGENRYLVAATKTRSEFDRVSEKYSAFNLSALHQLESDNTGKKYFALSRKTKEAGIINFSRSGSFSVLSKTKINGYATSIDVGKLEEKGKPKFLIAGTGVDGISINEEKNRKITELDNIKGRILSTALFADLNYDGFDDIVSFDVRSNSFVIYNNDGTGVFDEARSIGVGSEVNDLHKLDFNSDPFIDLAYLKNNNLEVMLGDSVSSFQKVYKFQAAQGVSKYTVFDFNGDGFNDVAYINQNKEKVFVSFGKNGNTFYEPLCYLTGENFSDITSYVDRGGRKLTVLSNTGTCYIISSLQLQDDKFSIALSEKPEAIKSFDHNNDGFKEIAFVDNASHSLKIGLSERRNLFRTFYNLSISTSPTDFIVGVNKRKQAIFVLFSKHKREIELLRYDFEKNLSDKKIIYTNTPIIDVKKQYDRLDDRFIVSVITKNGKDLFLEEYSFKNFISQSVKVNQIASNVVDAALGKNVFHDIYALVNNGKNLELVKIIFEKRETKRLPRLTFEVADKDKIVSRIVMFDELIDNTKPAAALFIINNRSVLYYFKNEKNIRVEVKKDLSTNQPMLYGLMKGDVLFYIINEKSKKLIEINVHNKSVKEIASFEDMSINNYFVGDLNNYSRFLIYSNNAKNYYTFKKL